MTVLDNIPWLVVVGTNGLGLGGGGPFNNFGLARRGGLEGSMGLDPSILELSGDLSPSRLRLRLLERTASSLIVVHSVLEVASGEVSPSIATVWLRGFLASEAFCGVLETAEAAGPFDCDCMWGYRGHT